MAEARSPQEQASAWLTIQKATHVVYQLFPNPASTDDCYDPKERGELSPRCPGFDLSRKANELGIDFPYCQAGESWLLPNTGWQRYFELWPDGPEGHLAWWYVKIAPPCCDECSPMGKEGIEEERGKLEDFVKRFPNSSLRAQADRRITQLERELQAEE